MRAVLSAACAALAASVPVTEAYQPLNPPSLPFQTPFYGRLRSTPPSSAARLRDRLIHLVWGAPPSSSAPKDSLPPAAAPQALLAQYGGDVVLRFNISSAEEALALADAAGTLFLDVWEHTAKWADIRLAKDAVPTLLEMLPRSLHHAHAPLMHDLAQAIHETFPSAALADPSAQPRGHARSFSAAVAASQQENLFFSDYQPLSVIQPWMRLLRSLFPTHVRLESLGTSAEGRDILGLRVGAHATNAQRPAGPRRTVLVTGGAHAREWISTAAVSYAAYALVTGYGKDRELTKLVDELDFVFVPTVNPDGYVYSWETDRLWRKTRQPTSLRFCRGLDMDRSFPFQWDGAATAGNPCSEAYAGDAPLESVEARRVADWARADPATEVVAFVDLHSYSQQVLYPFAYSCVATPPTLENLEELGLGLAKAMRLADGLAYDVTSACQGSVAGAAAWPGVESLGGSALDYMYHEAGVRHAYQIKLRDRGSYGFLLPAKHILPVGREVFGVVDFLGRFLLGDRGIEHGRDGDEAPSAQPAPESVTEPDADGDDGDDDDDVYDGTALEL